MRKTNSESSEVDPPLDGSSIREAIVRSGYLLEQRVESRLRASGYEVHASRRVLDPETGKAREMDLLAELSEIRTFGQVPKRPHVSASLLIECVNNRFPFAFFKKSVTYDEGCLPASVFGVPLWIPERKAENRLVRLEDELSISCMTALSEWATQFCSFEEKKNGTGQSSRLTAIQSPDHHGTFEKLMTESERLAVEVMNTDYSQSGFGEGLIKLIRPVVVLQGKLISVSTERDNIVIDESEHIRYLRRAVFDATPVAWVADVVTEAGLVPYLKAVDETLDKMRSYLEANFDRVKVALDIRNIQELSKQTRTPHR